MVSMSSGAEDYKRLMGRWSRSSAPLLIELAEVQDGDKTLEVGCGTGSLTRAPLENLANSEIVSIDPASRYIEYLKQQLIDPRLLSNVGGITAAGQRPNYVDNKGRTNDGLNREDCVCHGR